jgi:hypothetical protein
MNLNHIESAKKSNIDHKPLSPTSQTATPRAHSDLKTSAAVILDPESGCNIA